MVIDEFHVEGIAVAPPKAHPPLVVHPDTVLTGAPARKLLELIAWRHPQVVEGFGRVHHNELPQSRPLQVWRPAPNSLASKQPFGVPIGKAPNHLASITPHVINVKRDDLAV